jgi:hypothetical protein
MSEIVTFQSRGLTETFREAIHEMARYMEFLHANRLKQVELPDANWFRAVCLFVAMGAVETLLNAWLLRDANPHGMRGAAKLAAGIALGNMAFGFIVGWTFGRLRLHVKIIPRVVGWLGCIALLALAVWANAVTAVARHDMFVDHLEMSEAFATAGASLRTHYDLFWRDPEVVALLAIGICFWGLSFWEALIVRAPYPGHYAFWQRVKKAKERATDALAHWIAELDVLMKG